MKRFSIMDLETLERRFIRARNLAAFILMAMLLIFPIYNTGAQTPQTTTEDAAVAAAKNAAAAEAAAKTAAEAAAKTAKNAQNAADAAAKNAADAQNAADAAAENATEAKNAADAKNIAVATQAADAASKNAKDANDLANEASSNYKSDRSLSEIIITGLDYLVPIGIFAIAIFLLGSIAYGIYNSSFLTHMENPAIARGIITFLFTVSTVVIALMIVLGSLLGNVAELAPRFQQGKEVLSVLIGVFGTIIGFYFGQARDTGSTAVVPGPVPTLDNITPSSAARGATALDVKISGQNLGRVQNVQLIKAGSPPITATNVVHQAPTEISCRFEILGTAPAGDWDLVVDEGTGGREAKKVGAFKVV